jgi:CubicO group peptidase (beta-lactamase class C family)
MSPVSQVSTSAPIEGVCPDRFEKVRQAFIGNFENRDDIGASAAVYLNGEPVVDLWGGYFDESRTHPWEHDTIVNTFSTTKTMTALARVRAERQVRRAGEAPPLTLGGVARLG